MKTNAGKILCAVLVCIMAISGCTEKKQTNSGSGTTAVKWYMSGVKKDSSYDRVFDEVNKLMEERYGLKLDISMIDGGNYASKMQMINAGLEPYDLAFTSSWTNDYYKNIANNSLYDITELLPKLAPQLYASIEQEVLKAIEVDGKIFAVPNWQVQAKASAFIAPTDKLEKVGMNINDINDLDDITTYLRKLHEAEPESNKLGQNWKQIMAYFGMTPVGNENAPGAIYFTQEGKPTVINQFETPEFEKYVNQMYSWVQEGLVDNVYRVNDNSGAKEIQQCPFYFHTYKPGLEQEILKSKGYAWSCKKFSNAVVGQESLLATMLAVGAYSEHPEDAVRVMEIMNTDKEIYNMLSWGLEGKNYEKVSDNKIRIMENNTYSIPNWSIGSCANSYLMETQEDDIWEQTKQYNDEAVKSPLLGFVLNQDSIASQLTNCETVISEQLAMLELGLTDPAVSLPKFIEGLKTAGVDDLIANIQSQIDEWWENR